jgi:hypothetical protein
MRPVLNIMKLAGCLSLSTGLFWMMFWSYSTNRGRRPLTETILRKPLFHKRGVGAKTSAARNGADARTVAGHLKIQYGGAKMGTSCGTRSQDSGVRGQGSRPGKNSADL